MTKNEPVTHGKDRDISVQASMDAFLRLSEAWQLSVDDQIKLLGSPGRSTFFKWKKEGGSIPKDTIERLSHIFSIYKCLQILVPDPYSADAWIKKPNKYFNNQSALEIMLGGQVVDIYKVRQYLDAQRGG